MSTRAMQLLTDKNIQFEAISYEHQVKGVKFASEAMHFPLERTIKTLVVEVGKKEYILALMPGDRQLSMKLLAKALTAKRAAMVDTDTAQRLTGYWVGGISPFGTRQAMKVVMEQRLLEFDKVAVNGGQRGVMLIMDPRDIIRATQGLEAPLVQE